MTADGWAPIVVVGDAPPEEPSRAGRDAHPSRPADPVRFAGVPSLSASLELAGWQPVEDRRPDGAPCVPVPRYRSPWAAPGRQDLIPATYPHYGP